MAAADRWLWPSPDPEPYERRLAITADSLARYLRRIRPLMDGSSVVRALLPRLGRRPFVLRSLGRRGRFRPNSGQAARSAMIVRCWLVRACCGCWFVAPRRWKPRFAARMRRPVHIGARSHSTPFTRLLWRAEPPLGSATASGCRAAPGGEPPACRPAIVLAARCGRDRDAHGCATSPRE